MASTRRVAAMWQKSKSSSFNREAKVRTLSSLTVGAKGLYVEVEIVSGDISFSDLESVKQHGDSLVETLVADVDRKRVVGGRLSVAEPMLEAIPFKIVWEISANWVVDEETLLHKLDQAGVSLPFDRFHWEY